MSRKKYLLIIREVHQEYCRIWKTVSFRPHVRDCSPCALRYLAALDMTGEPASGVSLHLKLSVISFQSKVSGRRPLNLNWQISTPLGYKLHAVETSTANQCH